jgi:cyclohexadieny/prephenate dehydrogenase
VRFPPGPEPLRADPPSVFLFQRVAIIGLGLIGGSIGLACRARALAREIRGADVDEHQGNLAQTLGCVDHAVGDVVAAIDGAELVVLAVPVGAMTDVIEQVSPHLGPGAIVTDVGSVKGPIAGSMDRLVPGGRAVPGHPIAGRERSGPAAASADLFVGAKCVLTPTRATDHHALKRVRELWTGVGAEVVEMTPDHHDMVFAAVSHLPHVVAYALMGVMLDLADDGEDVRDFAAGGLRDFTRVAMSHPTMWRDICLANRSQILDMIARFRVALSQLQVMIEAADGEALHRQFGRARAFREGVSEKPAGDRRPPT